MAILDPFTGRPVSASATPLTDEQRAQLLAAELRAKPGPMIAALDALTAYTAAKLLQIAIAHPDVSAPYAEPGRAVIDLVREYFAGAPTVLEQLADGPPPGVTDDDVDATREQLNAEAPSLADPIEDLGDALDHCLEIFGRGLPASRVARAVERVLARRGFTAAVVPGVDA